jgi:hypothetical protein
LGTKPGNCRDRAFPAVEIPVYCTFLHFWDEFGLFGDFLTLVRTVFEDEMSAFFPTILLPNAKFGSFFRTVLPQNSNFGTLFRPFRYQTPISGLFSDRFSARTKFDTQVTLKFEDVGSLLAASMSWMSELQHVLQFARLAGQSRACTATRAHNLANPPQSTPIHHAD